MKVKELTDLPAVRRYLERIDAEPRTFKTAVVSDLIEGYRRDIDVVRFSSLGEVTCRETENQPTEDEATAIKLEFKEAEWPELKRIDRLPDRSKIHPNVANATSKSIFEFRDAENKIVMIQVRVEKEDGTKNYVPFTYWDDDEWRMCEPDEQLPLYNGHRLREAATVYIHEGAKAARECQRLVDGTVRQDKDDLAAHPWGRELGPCIHLGWIGGATNPYRTDWSIIKKAGVSTIYIVADNDRVGWDAVPAISKMIGGSVDFLSFDDRWPQGFDLADPWPTHSEWWHEKRYMGPTWHDCLKSATWATRAIRTSESDKKIYKVRREFSQEWVFVADPAVFANLRNPSRLLTEKVFNRTVRPFSDVDDTARLLGRELSSRFDGLTYRPGEERTIQVEGNRLFNTYVAPSIRSRQGDAALWKDFLEHLFPDPGDCHEVAHWCATLIARPKIRMGYGLLLISETQGVGKSTLGEYILAPLVGRPNISVPTQNDVEESAFNGWVAHRRLAIIHEIYSGKTRKTYDKVKSLITDPWVTVNRKYVEPYELENYCHILACSNSLLAIHIDNGDRRWLVPQVTEVQREEEWWSALHRWLSAGGLEEIQHWAEAFVDRHGPVSAGRHAPMTSMKMRVVDESMSDGQRLAWDIGSAAMSADKRIVLVVEDVRKWVGDQRQLPLSAPQLEKTHTLRKALVSAGMHERKAHTGQRDPRVKIKGVRKTVVATFELSGDETWSNLKEFHIDPGELAEM